MTSAWFERRYIRKQGMTRHKLTLHPVAWQGWVFLVLGILAIVAVSTLAPLVASLLGVSSILWLSISIPACLVIVLGGAWCKSRSVENRNDPS
jgi:hypothetical protein